MGETKLSTFSVREHLSTGEAAALCSVTPDTVLKWIRSGKIPASRTPGGHHRIPRSALLSILEGNRLAPQPKYGGGFQYCWEFNSKSGRIQDDCQACIVYRSRTRRCYEMSNLPAEAGHARLFCKSSCEECEYYQMVKGQRPNMLVVTDQDRVKVSLQRDAKDVAFNLRITDCEYRCSMLIEQFRPDYVVIDCSIGTERSREFAKLLFEDPRIPLVRIVLAGNGQELPKECDKMVFAMIDRCFTTDTLSGLVAGVHS